MKAECSLNGQVRFVAGHKLETGHVEETFVRPGATADSCSGRTLALSREGRLGGREANG